ncbi:N-6 DNA methylase [Leuconostoc suionicum]|uniref:N-6 DNA methylase n=1 Tax=Leuconostoc suionicum TaxID=1511761 RepID=UPI003C5A8293
MPEIDITGLKNEADVEIKFVNDFLLKEILHINSKNIQYHVPIEFHQGRETKKKNLDVLITDNNQQPLFIIDSKSPSENLESFFGQIDSYAFSLEVGLSILTNAERTIIRVYDKGNKKSVVLDDNFSSLQNNKFSELISQVNNINAYKNKFPITNVTPMSSSKKTFVTNYRRTFRSIHNTIRSIDKLDPTSSFDEFSKALFINIINDKVDDNEKLTSTKLKNLGNSSTQESFATTWFQNKVAKFYPGIFSEKETINLSAPALVAVLKVLEEEFNLKDSENDLKGRAFEEFLPSQLRGKGLGQYFTPRPVVNFMIEQAKISFKDKVLDFASGSGGFLIKAFHEKQKIINSFPTSALEAMGKTREQLLEDSKQQIFGIDAEPRAVRTAKMNMLLWGDGKQIQHGNGLSNYDKHGQKYLATEFDPQEKESGVDVILANPPFGSKEKDQSILKNYTLSPKSKKKKTETETETETELYSEQKTENLFVERAWKLLRPGGRLLIVLPEGIFSNKSSNTRDFILSHFNIESIIRLPKHTFVMSGVDTINTVILIAYKNSNSRQEQIMLSDKHTWISPSIPMKIKFASVNQIGYEPSGQIIDRGYETSDLNTLSQKLMDDDSTDIFIDPFKFADIEFSDNEKSKNWKNTMLKYTEINFTEVPKRLDPTFFFFQEETKSFLANYQPIPQLKIFSKNKILDTELDNNNNIEKSYRYVSVVKNYKSVITDITEKSVDELLATNNSSRPQRLTFNSLVFNPYRINTGSIIRIDSEAENLITSPAYISFISEEIDSTYLVHLLKTPFMKYQIQVLASGSVRDNFSVESLRKLRIPKITIEEQQKGLEKIKSTINTIEKAQSLIEKNVADINELLTTNILDS